ncbi:LysR family transcriptional regulator [Paracandidimonas soli]|uniref:DNA-binding transcriptional LysR family regulator n=1 Tax=Paracandidimonas soli TaxID=1917182 RepID=A0A4R3VI78_9BURK|nr:LysR family transcriptional regulator [Paracandidimonas soli]TCV02655.1 DNA-binding transcriptional LysR family regulator [Paracandidimonas soli]
MELRHLRYFLAVAHELHFTRAAEKLGIGQPPLSQQIQQLERELGVTLLLRGRRGVELTEAGHAFREEALRTLGAADRAMETARRVGNSEIDKLAIGFTVSASIHPFVPRVIRASRERLPQVEIMLQQHTTNELIAAVKDRQIDVAFIRAPAPEAAGVQVETLLHEPLVAVLSTAHPLARRKTIRLKDLAGEPFIFYPRKVGTGIYDAVVQACQSCGFSPEVRFEVPQMTSVITFVAAGMGVSLVPQTMRQLRAEGVKYISIADADVPQAHLALAFNRRALSLALSRFITQVREFAVRYEGRNSGV